MLRLDLVHPVVSGNKMFKLSRYLVLARAMGYQGVASFGGAWSNHLHALAFAAKEAGLEAIGFVRGDAGTNNSMLGDCRQWGMSVHFLDRGAYRRLQSVLKNPVDLQPNATIAETLSATIQPSPFPGTALLIHQQQQFLLVPEGGFGKPGLEGATSIWDCIPADTYTHLIGAVGTGAMMAGLALGRGRNPERHSTELIGMPVLKNDGLEKDISQLLAGFQGIDPPTLIHRFHGGGYAKTAPLLLRFMQDFYAQTGIPTDLVYTAKLMQGIRTLAAEGYFPRHSAILAIHSGGLQGNRSLKKGILPY